MNIPGFIEIDRNPQDLRPGTDIAEGSMGGLFHYIAQVAGQLQFPGALHHIDLHFQGLSAHGSPSQAGNQTHRIRRRKLIRRELANA